MPFIAFHQLLPAHLLTDLDKPTIESFHENAQPLIDENSLTNSHTLTFDSSYGHEKPNAPTPSVVHASVTSASSDDANRSGPLIAFGCLEWIRFIT